MLKFESKEGLIRNIKSDENMIIMEDFNAVVGQGGTVTVNDLDQEKGMSKKKH